METLDPTKEELLAAEPGTIDTESLRFDGTRGNPKRHLSRAQLEQALAALPSAPLNRGRVELLVARPTVGAREMPSEVVLSPDGGMPGDRWADDDRYGPAFQLATTRSDLATIIANGQPLELHGDNLYLHLDLSASNLPPGSILRMGEARLQVTPQPHNGCKKWVQRFGLDVMQMNMDTALRPMHLRGIYLQVVEPGRVRVGDEVVVERRGNAAA